MKFLNFVHSTPSPYFATNEKKIKYLHIFFIHGQKQFFVHLLYNRLKLKNEKFMTFIWHMFFRLADYKSEVSFNNYQYELSIIQ